MRICGPGQDRRKPRGTYGAGREALAAGHWRIAGIELGTLGNVEAIEAPSTNRFLLITFAQLRNVF